MLKYSDLLILGLSQPMFMLGNASFCLLMQGYASLCACHFLPWSIPLTTNKHLILSFPIIAIIAGLSPQKKLSIFLNLWLYPHSHLWWGISTEDLDLCFGSQSPSKFVFIFSGYKKEYFYVINYDRANSTHGHRLL